MSNFYTGIDLHSINPVGDEVVTFKLCYERFIHAEFMTHRWARNASSSRAIPYKRMKEWILADPAMPLHLGTNRPGMQSGAECDQPAACRASLYNLLSITVPWCDKLVEEFKLHKELVNRYTEAWGWIHVVATMGRPQLMNFFSLRCSPYAHPNMQRLAVHMARAYRASTPTQLAAGEWHLPFLDAGVGLTLEDKLRWSVARCAWTSYQTVEGKVATYEDACRRHDACVELKHVTPLEHQYRARDDHGRNGGCVGGFDQYRAMIAGESVSEFDFGMLEPGGLYADCDWRVA